MKYPELIDQVFAQYQNHSKKFSDLYPSISVHDPGSGELLYRIPATIDTEIEEILEFATDKTLILSSPDQRQVAMSKWADLVSNYKDDLSIVVSLEGGKLYREASTEVDSVIKTIRSFADFLQSDSDLFHPVKVRNNLIRHVPLGLHYCVTPWNFPAAMVARKVCPALTAGCPVILKPDHRTPLSAMILMHLAVQSGFHRASCRLILTSDPQSCTTLILRDPLIVQRVTFTGSTKVGALLSAEARVRPCGLELGGSAPFIVHSSADLHLAVQDLISSRFRHSGQTCICANRAIIDSAIYDRFNEMLKRAIDEMYGGLDDKHQLEEGCLMGPLIDKAALDRLHSELASSIWQPKLDNTTRFPPTIVYEEPNHHTKHEIFGPIIRLVQFTTTEECLQLAQSNYGLAAYLYSESTPFTDYITDNLQVGMLGVNTTDLVSADLPFAGCLESGHGVEGRPDLSVRESMRVHLIARPQ